ncbi:hypothetical protein EW146_g1725 [Bondarzewia mesenterica]|uniref:Uncharacterized protein n=1 Tax=Bondarzewia mesenterica TaxID=1095465 RepID=A0A4S4M300_9AGAM|nr:hypothetical protein EW146_g1725 [Bondarzewia mesenterica]
MSPPHAYTLGVATGIPIPDDDDDICPVCEGECTCYSTSIATTTQPTPTPRTTITVPSARPSSTATSASSRGPLKIKLTVPPGLLARARLASSSTKKINNTSDVAQPVKRRGRPPKAVAAPKPKQPLSKSKGKDTIGKTARRKACSDDEYCPAGAGPSSSSIRTDVFQAHQNTGEDDEVDEMQSIQFPTFVSAVSSSSADESSSSDDDTASSGFSTDSSIEDEEESFILNEEQQRAHAHDKARVKRELLGDGANKWKERRNNWEIRPRKKSVGPSGDEMDMDSDDSEDDGEDEDEDEDADQEDNEGDDDGDADMDGEDNSSRVMYAGIATSWSEGEESSFDAELFFAGLDDSDSGADGVQEHANDDETADEDEDELALDAMALAASAIFEVTEGWDGSVIFTNGLKDGQGLLDFDFEANAAQLVQAGTGDDEGDDTDVQMSEADGMLTDSEEDDALEEMDSDGETTEEELVDEKGLPTARAMRLFRPPTTPSSIDPMSTMSPGPRPRAASYHDHRESPKPADILAGRIYMDDEDEDEEPPVSDVASMTLSSRSERDTPRIPIMGTFAADKSDALRRAVIDGSKNDIPSPFPKQRKRILSNPWSGRSVSSSRDRSHSLSSLSQQPQFMLSPSPFGQLPLSDDPASQASPDHPPAAPIELDDVLDASMLDSDPFDAQMSGLPSSSGLGDEAMYVESNGERHLQSLSRWDRVPIGTFRRTRESGLADGGNELAYGGMIRSSPFTGMLWQDKSTAGANDGGVSTPTSRGKNGRRRGKGRMDVVISPVILPVRDRDGDRTPTQSGGHSPPHSKPRKSSRKEKMLKKKSMLGAAAGRRPMQHHHHHGHHPNAKGRAAGSVQRSGLFGGSVPPLSL